MDNNYQTQILDGLLQSYRLEWEANKTMGHFSVLNEQPSLPKIEIETKNKTQPANQGKLF